MLSVLRIKNLALVEDLTLELAPGYNAITGETGAGKSILIGALNLLLGERADRTLIRSGADGCTVEACFDVSALGDSISRLLEEHGLEQCHDAQLLLKRTFGATGTNRQFVNGSPTTLQVLGSVGEWLVDIHGPHDHQSLLHPARQLLILDAFAGLRAFHDEFTSQLRARSALEAEKAALIVDEKTYAQQLDLLRFQTREIHSARLQAGEDAAVEQEYRRASNAAKLIELSQGALALLNGEDASLMSQAGSLGRLLQELQRLDPLASALTEAHEELIQRLGELQNELSHYADRVEMDPERLHELEVRLNLLQSLKRKYGPSLAEVIAFGREAADKLRQLEQRDTELARIQSELEKLNAALWQAGQDLSRRRRKAISKLCRAVVQQLQDLGFVQSDFSIDVRTLAEGDLANVSPSGLDEVEFQFAPNPGEPARPLRAIASSGELARVMLALKTVLAAEDQVPVLVFDEVDANVGGETARAVGHKMREIGRQRQVLCVTHLAPVAACASTHFVVTKQTKAGRTISTIQRLTQEERVAELTRMLGGPSQAARQHAQALLDNDTARAERR